MLPIAFTESIDLKNRIRNIETLREKILCTPITPKTELKLRWEAQITRIHSSLSLSGQQISRGQIVKLIGNRAKHIPGEYQIVLALKRSFDYIYEYWSANPKPVTIQTVITVTDIAGLFPNTTERVLQESDGAVRSTLEYLAAQRDHPIIQAGIALCLLSTKAQVADDTGIVARLFSFLFLSKAGFDVRRLLTVEKNWLASGQSYDLALNSIRKEGNLNHWLMYFTQTMEDNLQERLKDIENPRIHLDLPASFWELNDRQKTVLDFVSEPGCSITNKKLQSLCSVSQITASRDLSKLTTLGFLTAHGSGRSVSYTKT